MIHFLLHCFMCAVIGHVGAKVFSSFRRRRWHEPKLLASSPALRRPMRAYVQVAGSNVQHQIGDHRADHLGAFLTAYDEYLDGKRSYDDLPLVPAATPSYGATAPKETS